MRAVPLRVVHVINSLSVGGAEMMLCKLLSATDRSRFEPVVVSLTSHVPLRERIVALGVPVRTVGLCADLRAPAAAWRFLQILRSASADLVQGWQYHGSLAATFGQAWVGPRVPILWNIRHSLYDLDDEKRLTAATVRLGARCSHRAARIVYPAHASARQHEAIGYRSDRRVVLPNGFDVVRFAPDDEARGHLRRALGLSAAAVLVGKVARYHRMKDHAGFLRAAALLGRTHPDVQFVLAGDRVDRLNPELTRLVAELHLTQRVHLLGRRDDVPRVLAALDVLTSASAYGEAFPNVLGEAMACGVPCVATDVGDSALVIGKLGRVVPPRRPAALAEAWADLIALGRDGRVALGALARRRIVERYGLRAVVARYEDLYDELAGRPVELQTG